MSSPDLVAGRYRLHERLGKGGMGVVWRAVDTELGRTVAVKRATAAGAGLAAKEIRREARMAAGVHHPGVVTLFDVVVKDDECWLVMEYLQARSLAEMLEQQQTLPVGQVAKIGAQLASALQAVHDAGVLHRDIKPGNVLVTDDSTAKLTDFGISRPVWGDVTATDSAVIGGTPAFLSPEVANGAEPSTASDVFSLGATLYTAIEGAPPFGRADNPLALIRRAASGDVRPPRAAGALTPVLEAMLDPDPARRPDAATAAESLDEVAADPTQPMPSGRRPRPAGAPGAPAQGARRRRRRAAVLTAAGVALVAAVALTMVLREVGSGAPPAKAGPATLLGDPRTVDPCALVDPKPLGRFGETALEPDYGNFNRCDVIIEPNQETEVDMAVELDDTGPAGGTGNGEIGVDREPLGDAECERTLRLPAEPHLVRIRADQDEDEEPADLCGIADSATRTALAALHRGTLPRRQPADPNGLIRSHACGMLDVNALARIPGVDADHPEQGFGDWECDWHSTTSDLHVDLRFDRNNEPLGAVDGRPVRLGGRTAFVAPEDEGEGTCVTVLTHRVYSSPEYERPVELVRILAEGPQPMPELCDIATDLARAAAHRLPPRG